ncbi:MAG: RimK family alpha-L-glutamate ligase [Desulfobacterales bacterium]|jgi:ribosomal protein S6--L-glutamate ligase|nr:RimK family alpha-L-glutamate ligase [Desulfobacterales bacterium]
MSHPLERKVIALEARLRECRNVVTLGVKPNFSDYSPEEARMIRSAKKIYYPSSFYADLFETAGIRTFPSYHTYKCVQDKIRQSTLFQLLRIQHPKTRFYYGKKQQQKITEHFDFPFIGKIPRGSAMGRGVYLISTTDELQAYLADTDLAYIQTYLPIDRDMRIVVIGSRVVHSYWRVAPEGDFRSNVAVGGNILMNPVPEEALNLARRTARECRWDDVGIDICCHEGTYYVLEANMKYGKEGFRKAGIDYWRLMEQLIENEEI